MSVTGGTYKWLTQLADDQKKLVWRGDLPEIFYGSRAPSMTLISESGLYKLIMRAQTKNPAARAFQDWVTRVVLPAIKKDGMYVAGEETEAWAELTEDERVLQVMTMLTAKNARYRMERDTACSALNTIADTEGTFTLTESAKTLGVAPGKLIAELVERD